MLRSYAKLAVKVLLRRKFFTFISLFGIGFPLMIVVSAVALFDHSFAPHAPETRGARTLLVMSLELRGPHTARNGLAGYGFLDRSIRTLPNVERVAIVSGPDTAVTFHGGRRVSFFLRRTDGEFWKIMDFSFAAGRAITAEDDQGAARVAVINRSTAERLFGTASALDRKIEIAGDSFRVVGVVADVPVTRLVPFADVWVPISSARGEAYKREIVGNFIGIVLAHRQSDFPAIRAAVRERVKGVELEPPFESLSGSADTLFETVSHQVLGGDGSAAARFRALGMAGVLLFLLLPTVNLVNINASRMLERAAEIGVRRAFGATRAALVAQFLVENLVLTVAGSGLGLVATWGLLHAINRSGLIPYANLGFNPRVLAGAFAVTIIFALMSGVYPAWRMSRLHPVDALRGGGRA